MNTIAMYNDSCIARNHNENLNGINIAPKMHSLDCKEPIRIELFYTVHKARDNMWSPQQGRDAMIYLTPLDMKERLHLWMGFCIVLSLV